MLYAVKSGILFQADGITITSQENNVGIKNLMID